MSRYFLKSILNQPKLPTTEISKYALAKAIGKLSEDNELKFLSQFKKHSIKKRFAIFGRNSGLKPEICWPNREELRFMKQYQEKFEQSVETMQQALMERKRIEKEKRAQREKEINENLKKLPKMKEEFWASYHKMHQNIKDENLKNEKLIQEIREYLGYEIDPKDPRFEEALQKREEESKAAMRAARKLDKQKQQMEMLQMLLNEALEKEKEVKMNENEKNAPDTKTNQSINKE